MIRLTSRLALFAVVAVLALSSTAHAATRVFVQVGAPIVAPVPPPVIAPVPVVAAPAPYGYVWRPGYYMWTGYGYRLVPGIWVRPPYAGAAWVPGRWVAHGRGHMWVRGYWRR